MDTEKLRTLFRKQLHLVGPWSGTIYRFTEVRYANSIDLLSGVGSKKHGGRWNPPEMFNCVYGSLDHHVAMGESLATFHSYGIPPEKARPRVFVAISLNLQTVLDLTQNHCLDQMKVTLKQLTSVDWEKEQRDGREAITQTIGRIAWEEKLEAIIVPSTRLKGAANLVLFPGRRKTGSSWKIQGARDLPKK